jgi:fumarylacetoacetase
VRPKGQFRYEEKVVYGATRKLDYELEVAAVVGKASVLGEPVWIEDADTYIFGCVLVNDWSGEFSPLLLAPQ